MLALLLSFDTVVGESERGSLILLMSYPLSRTQLLLGKFFGHLMVLDRWRYLFGYGAAAVYLCYSLDQGSAAEWAAYAGDDGEQHICSVPCFSPPDR